MAVRRPERRGEARKRNWLRAQTGSSVAEGFPLLVHNPRIDRLVGTTWHMAFVRTLRWVGRSCPGEPHILHLSQRYFWI